MPKPNQRVQKSPSRAVRGPKGSRDHQLDMAGKSKKSDPTAAADDSNSHSENGGDNNPSTLEARIQPSKHSNTITGTKSEQHRPARSMLADGPALWTGALSTTGIDDNGAVKIIR